LFTNIISCFEAVKSQNFGGVWVTASAMLK